MSALDTAKEIIGKYAPSIGAALGGPFGEAAGTMVSQVLGIDPKSAPETIAVAVVAATPDQQIAMRTIDTTFQIRMAEMGYADHQAIEELSVQDRQGARHMQEIIKSTTPTVLTYIVSAGFFGILTAMLFVDIPKENMAALNIMLGALGGVWIASSNFWYGSNHSAQNINTMLFNSTPKV